jgi:hypothetical protein
MSSNSIIPAIPKGNLSRISRASALLEALIIKTPPYPPA